MKKVGMLVIALLMGLAIAPLGRAEAALPPVGDYKIESGNYVFVMLYSSTSFNKGGENLRTTYKQSGLYKKDDPSTPLWSVDWYSNNVYLADDGQHLVSSDRGSTLEFYKDGKQINAYSSGELGYKPPASDKMVSCGPGWVSSVAVSGQNVNVSVSGAGGFIFDLDGKVKSGQLPSKDDGQRNQPNPQTNFKEGAAPVALENQNNSWLPFGIAMAGLLSLIVAVVSVMLLRKGRKPSRQS